MPRPTANKNLPVDAHQLPVSVVAVVNMPVMSTGDSRLRYEVGGPIVRTRPMMYARGTVIMADRSLGITDVTLSMVAVTFADLITSRCA